MKKYNEPEFITVSYSADEDILTASLNYSDLYDSSDYDFNIGGSSTNAVPTIGL